MPRGRLGNVKDQRSRAASRDSSLIDRVDCLTRRRVRLGAPKVISKRCRWLGVTFEEWRCDDSGEAPEGFLLNHLLTMQVGLPVELWFRWRSTPWRRYVVGPKQLQLIPSSIPYAVRWSVSACAVISVALEPSFIASVVGSAAHCVAELVPRPTFEDPLLTYLLFAMRDEARAGAPFGPAYGETLAVSLAAHLVRHYRKEHADSAAEVRPDVSKVRLQLRTAVEYINDNLSRTIHIQELADVAGLHVSHFIRAFRDLNGKPPHQYIMRQRVELGKRLLRESDLPVAEVAERCGFVTASHFSHVFRQMTNVSPKGYRDGGPSWASAAGSAG